MALSSRENLPGHKLHRRFAILLPSPAFVGEFYRALQHTSRLAGAFNGTRLLFDGLGEGVPDMSNALGQIRGGCGILVVPRQRLQRLRPIALERRPMHQRDRRRLQRGQAA